MTNEAKKEIQNRMDELKTIADKGNKEVAVLQQEIAERQRRIAAIREELIRMQGAYAELNHQLKSLDKKTEVKTEAKAEEPKAKK